MDKETLGSCLGAIVIFAITIIFGGVISFWLGYFGGWLLKCFIGELVANGLNMVLGNITQYNFKPEDIPLFTAIMTTIGGFFKASVSANSNKK